MAEELLAAAAAQLRAAEQQLQSRKQQALLPLPDGAASSAELLPNPAQLLECRPANGHMPEPEELATTVLVAAYGMSAELASELGGTSAAYASWVRGGTSGAAWLLLHLQERWGITRGGRMKAEAAQQVSELLADTLQVLQHGGADESLLTALAAVQPSPAYLRRFAGRGMKPTLPNFAAAVLLMYGTAWGEAQTIVAARAAAAGYGELRATVNAYALARGEALVRWLQRPLLEAGDASQEAAALRAAAGEVDVTSGAARLTGEQQVSYLTFKLRLTEATCRTGAALVREGTIALPAGEQLARSVAALPLPPEWDNFGGNTKARTIVGVALQLGLGFSLEAAAKAAGCDKDHLIEMLKNGKQHNGGRKATPPLTPLLRQLPQLMARFAAEQAEQAAEQAEQEQQAAEQAAEQEQPERLPPAELRAARMLQPSGLLAAAEAAAEEGSEAAFEALGGGGGGSGSHASGGSSGDRSAGKGASKGAKRQAGAGSGGRKKTKRG